MSERIAKAIQDIVSRLPKGDEKKDLFDLAEQICRLELAPMPGDASRIKNLMTAIDLLGTFQTIKDRLQKLDFVVVRMCHESDQIVESSRIAAMVASMTPEELALAIIDYNGKEDIGRANEDEGQDLLSDMIRLWLMGTHDVAQVEVHWKD